MVPSPEPGARTLRVRVVWAGPHGTRTIALELAAGATVGDALDRSGLLEQAERECGAAPGFGVFNRVRERSWPLHDGDRVEIYRSLQIDPKEARRLRAAKKTPSSSRG